MYNDQPVSSKSPPTRDKIHPEVKAQARIRSRNRGQDVIDSGMVEFYIYYTFPVKYNKISCNSRS